MEDSVVISASPADAFAYVTDFRNTAKWHKNMKKVGFRSTEPVGVGSEYDWTETFAGKTLDISGEITQWDPPHSFSWRATSGTLNVSGGWTFRRDGATTVVTRYSDTELSGFFKLMSSLMTPMARRQVKKELAELKRQIESLSH